ncbi:hypothetical protein WME99_36940 [Sorangium sp. So ce136]|uniref:hypothetical protein n=1 Tax=Sorangium sp. So ce136 TaxID=3133284 RepID=UPI003F0FAFB3
MQPARVGRVDDARSPRPFLLMTESRVLHAPWEALLALVLPARDARQRAGAAAPRPGG